jgi:Tfp pilus assembly protein PilO
MARFRTAPALSLIGVPELVGLGIAAVLLIVTVFTYVYFYLPSQSRLSSIELERSQLQGVVRAEEKNFDNTKSVREQVDEITGSMTEFENTWLAASGSGRLSLYTTLNTLIKNNGIRNTAGPSYTPLEPIGSKLQVNPSATADKQTNAKWQTIYPGIAVSVTVEGPYQRVRHFVRDIENSRQFLIINAVELESVTQSGTVAEMAPISEAGSASAGGRGMLVSLRLEMATYFKRSAENAP